MIIFLKHLKYIDLLHLKLLLVVIASNDDGLI